LSGTHTPQGATLSSGGRGAWRGILGSILQTIHGENVRGELPCYVGAMCVWVGVGGLGNDATVMTMLCFFSKSKSNECVCAVCVCSRLWATRARAS